MGQLHSLFAGDGGNRREARGKQIEAPRQDQGVRDALSQCFTTEPMPDDFRTLLSRLR